MLNVLFNYLSANTDFADQLKRFIEGSCSFINHKLIYRHYSFLIYHKLIKVARVRGKYEGRSSRKHVWFSISHLQNQVKYQIKKKYCLNSWKGYCILKPSADLYVFFLLVVYIILIKRCVGFLHSPIIKFISRISWTPQQFWNVAMHLEGMFKSTCPVIRHINLINKYCYNYETINV